MNCYHIPELAKQYTQYDMISIHTELPDFPALQTRLLCAFLEDSGQAEDGELYALAASLVQMGIDTHEMVSVSNEIKEKKAVRSRQLKVLAGDYFSSGFYHLLSQAGQIDMVRQLSAAICEVNRLKMTLYMRMKQLKVSAEEYIQQAVSIRSQLFLRFDRLMKGARHLMWPELVQDVARCQVLAEEISRSGDLRRFRDSWGFWHILQHGDKEERKQLEASEGEGQGLELEPMLSKYNVKEQLYAMLEEQVQRILDKARQLDSERLAQELRLIAESFFRMARQPKALEER